MKASEYFKDESKIYLEIFRRLASYVGKTLEQLDLPKIEKNRHQWPIDEHELTESGEKKYIHMWTEEEAKEFGKWFVDYVYKHRRALEFSYATKKMIHEKTYGHFLLMYGWRYKKDDKAKQEKK